MNPDRRPKLSPPHLIVIAGVAKTNPFAYLHPLARPEKRVRLQEAMSLLKMTASYLTGETYKGQTLEQIFAHWESLGWHHAPAARATLLKVYRHPRLEGHKLVFRTDRRYSAANVVLTDRVPETRFLRLFEVNSCWYLGKNEAGTRVLRRVENISVQLPNPVHVLEVFGV